MGLSWLSLHTCTHLVNNIHASCSERNSSSHMKHDVETIFATNRLCGSLAGGSAPMHTLDWNSIISAIAERNWHDGYFLHCNNRTSGAEALEYTQLNDQNAHDWIGREKRIGRQPIIHAPPVNTLQYPTEPALLALFHYCTAWSATSSQFRFLPSQ